MNLSHYLTILLAIIGLGMVIVYQQVESVRLGYRIDEQLREREELNEETRRLEVELLEAAQPGALVRRAHAMGVRVEETALPWPADPAHPEGTE